MRRRVSKRKKKNKNLELWVKASLLIAMALLFYITLFWEKKPAEETKELSRKEAVQGVVEAVYRSPKFQIQKSVEGLAEAKDSPTVSEKGEEPKSESSPKESPKVASEKGEKKRPTRKVYHVVQPGDSLWKLGKKYYGSGLKGELIYRANRQLISNKNVLPVGKKLVIPQPTRQVKVSSVQAESSTKKTERRAKNDKGQYLTYRVQDEDTLSTIAEDFYGTPKGWYRIWKANRHILKNPNRLKVGMVLKIPLRGKRRKP